MGLTYLDYMYQSYTGTADEFITNDPTRDSNYTFDSQYWRDGRTYTDRLQ